MKRLFLLWALMGSTLSFAQDSSKVCYGKAQMQRIAYRVMHSQYCDSIIPEYQQVVMNLEEELGIANRQKVLQDERYNQMDYLFSSCAGERTKLQKENDKMKRKLKRTRILGISLAGIAAVGWLLILL